MCVSPEQSWHHIHRSFDGRPNDFALFAIDAAKLERSVCEAGYHVEQSVGWKRPGTSIDFGRL